MGLAGLQQAVLGWEPEASRCTFEIYVERKNVMSAADDIGDERTLVITRTFDAPASRVFDAWLTRDQWQSWIGPEGVDCDVTELDPRVGGRYRLVMHLDGGTTIAVMGVFEVIDRPNILRFTWGAEADRTRQSAVELTFTERNGRTELVLRQERLGSAANREAHRGGWDSALNKLDRFLRTGERA